MTDMTPPERFIAALERRPIPGCVPFSTSNCAYTGMALRRYELIHDVWRRDGNYA